MSLVLAGLAGLAVFAGSLLAAGIAGAHTESDFVAVPAGEEATVRLRPTHGCGDSPTVAVRIRADVAGAVAEDVAGWTATSTPDGEGRTVVEWTGGVLPADETGDFPVRFMAPDTPGELLVFPAVQECENGEELAWIDGDPEGEFPAPRLLILPAGSEPAATTDDVPPDAPGRDQLVAFVDVDNPGGTTTTAVSTTAPADTTTTDAPDTDLDGTGDDAAGDDDDDDGVLVPAALALGAGAVAVVVVARWRRTPGAG